MLTSEAMLPHAKADFKKCITCSRTFAHILNRDFGHQKPDEEKALDPLAGGVMNSGHQCGMLWGAVSAAGLESYRRNQDPDQAKAIAITAAQEIITSFSEETGTPNCREIINCKLNTCWGLFKYMLKVTLQGMENSQCFNLAEKWAPTAISSARKVLSKEPMPYSQTVRSCAS